MIALRAGRHGRVALAGVVVASLAIVALVIAAIVAYSRGGSDSAAPHAASAPFTPSQIAEAAAPRLEPGPVVITRAGAVGPVALDPRHLVWESGAIEEGGAEAVVYQLELRSGRTTRLAREVNRSYGLASTSRWVVYVAGPDGRTVIAVDHAGSRERVLSELVTAPLASRGELVAWAEDDGTRQRVVVRHMRRAKQWSAAAMPRCVGGRCYRIDAVVLTRRGVVFSRGAIGPHPSLIVRRAFSAPRATVVRVVNDPQPDLVPSSKGALYYAFARGWYRWEFGEAMPRRASFRGVPPALVLGQENGRSLLATNKRCDTVVTADVGAPRAAVVASPEQVRAAAGVEDACVQLLASAWAGKQPLTAWAVVSEEEEDIEEKGGHGEEEAIGLLLAGEALP